MASNPQRVVVEVSSARVRLTVARGRAVTARKEREVESWDHACELLAETLGEWTRGLGLKNVRASVVYAGPSARAIVHSSPVESGRDQARADALRALPKGLGATHAHCIAADWAEPGGTTPARVHTLAAGDEPGTPVRLAGAVNASGLQAYEIIPGQAVLLAAATRQLSSLPRTSPPTMVVWVGEHACAIAAGDASRIARVVAIELGVRSTPTSLLLERLSDDLASILREHPELGARPSLVVAGEGFPGQELAERAALAWSEPGPACEPGASLIEALAGAGPTLVDLCPRDPADANGKRARVARVMGVTAALVAVAMHASSVRSQLSRAEARLARLGMDTGAAVDHAAIARCRNVADAQRRAFESLGRSIDPAAAMTLLAISTPSTIRFDRLEIDERGLRARGEIDPALGGPESMRALLDALNASPMVSATRLTPAPADAGPVRFELVVELRTSPRELGVLAGVVPAEGEP